MFDYATFTVNYEVVRGYAILGCKSMHKYFIRQMFRLF